MRCPYCRFRVFERDLDVLMAHIEERHPKEYRRRYVRHSDDVEADLADEEYEESQPSE